MPHISVKMIKGRTDEQKKRLSKALTAALQEALSVSDEYISLTIEDYTATEWQEIYANEITAKEDVLFKKPAYKPESLLKR